MYAFSLVTGSSMIDWKQWGRSRESPHQWTAARPPLAARGAGDEGDLALERFPQR
jgi:hypothetical protein